MMFKTPDERMDWEMDAVVQAMLNLYTEYMVATYGNYDDELYYYGIRYMGLHIEHTYMRYLNRLKTLMYMKQEWNRYKHRKEDEGKR